MTMTSAPKHVATDQSCCHLERLVVRIWATSLQLKGIQGTSSSMHLGLLSLSGCVLSSHARFIIAELPLSLSSPLQKNRPTETALVSNYGPVSRALDRSVESFLTNIGKGQAWQERSSSSHHDRMPAPTHGNVSFRPFTVNASDS